jgi:hypothetical protein
MRTRVSLMRLRMALLALVTLALVATGWAHRMPDVPDEALAFIISTGATPADFCGDVGGGTHDDPLCQACQIAGGLDLPPLAGAALQLDLRIAQAALHPDHGVVLTRALDLSHAPQGPPVA